ncbi:MAG TPA: universal stress protein [Cyanobacteria bacterium UBA8553]|nr:universal stress protein [Cyanobacteria bacterium UBA8553]HAJ63255.1 universal stress protein [Cyanobacteria bacterium UBA8543]
MRYRKILVALDRSPQADIVFEQALELAKKDEASLMLSHCLPSDLQGSSLYADVYGVGLVNYSHEIQEQLKKEKEEARELLARYCETSTAQGVLTEWDVRAGDAGKAIAELANSWDADLVVLGRRGHRGLTEMVLGSVSNYVVHHAPCSVLIVQGIKPTVEEIPETVTQATS